jgi:hypothetical protein
VRWFDRSEILDAIITSYAGVENGKRQFIWESENGDVVLGNARAFSDHLEARFGLPKRPGRWTAVHRVLHELGEAVKSINAHPGKKGQHFRNQEPEMRVLRRKRERRS